MAAHEQHSVRSRSANGSIRYLLMQIRRPGDPIIQKELACFARSLSCPAHQITPLDLINERASRALLRSHDMVLIGGSGDYSVPKGGPWLESALDAMRLLVEHSKPTFASCWGFQALAQALGGHVVFDPERAEIGTLTLHLSEDGKQDPIFSRMGDRFKAQVGHEDTVDRLPPSAVLMASSASVRNHAFKIRSKPIYATQFHPELRKHEMVTRLSHYPHYVESIAGVTMDQFAAGLSETPRANDLLRAFVRHVFGD